MKAKLILAAIAVAATLAWQAEAQSYDTNGVVVQTFAGSGFAGYLDGVGQQTMFSGPWELVADSQGNLFALDNLRIRKITPDSTVSTFAGGGSVFPAYGTNAHLGPASNYGQLTSDRFNTIWTTQTLISTNGLLRIGNDGYVSWIPLTTLSSVASHGVCVDSANNIYVSDSYRNIIYRYRTNSVLEVFAGSGNSGAIDGNGIFTSFSSPAALAIDAADNIYVWDSGNHLIRRVNQSRDVVTIAGMKGVSSDADGLGTNATFSSISTMCADGSGNLILACNTCIRRISAATNVTTIAGSFSQSGYTNGAGNLARFSGASGVCVAGGTIYVADSSNHRIRSITNNPTAQLVLPANLQLDTYPGLRITGTVGRTYRIESSPDTTNWSTSTTLLLTSSPYLWFDQNPVSGNKFYRALLLP